MTTGLRWLVIACALWSANAHALPQASCPTAIEASRAYAAETLEARDRLAREVGAAYSGLALREPGIVSRLDHFIAFAKFKLAQNPKMSAGALRDAYSALLGVTTYYRGLALTEAELAAIDANGLKLPEGFSTDQAKIGVARLGVRYAIDRRAGFSRLDVGRLELQKTGIAQPTPTQVWTYVEENETHVDLVRKQIMFGPKYLASVSRDAFAAAWVAGASKKEGRAVHVFTITIERVDTIHGNDFESWIVADVPVGRFSHRPVDARHFDHSDFTDILRQARVTDDHLPEIPK